MQNKRIRDYYLGIKVYVVEPTSFQIDTYEVINMSLYHSREVMSAEIKLMHLAKTIPVKIEVPSGAVTNLEGYFTSLDINDCKKEVVSNIERSKELLIEKVDDARSQISEMDDLILKVNDTLT